MHPVYNLRLLGPVQLQKEEMPLSGFISQKVVALLGYLVTVNQPVTRSYLATLFWPDKSEARGRGNLSRALNNLYTLLPDCLTVDYFTVQINLAIFRQVDTLIFETLLADQTFEALTQAAALYQGDFMEDVRLKNCPEFENWLLTEREQWRNQVTVAVQKLVTHHLARQEQDQALYFLNRLLKLNPWQEEAHHQLMLLLARRGQRSAALVQYKTCKRVLNEELGVEPSADIIDLYQRIRAMETPPPKKLPMSAIPFIGRQTEIARVIQGLDDPHCRMLTLHGPGGVGKTRLALAAAHQLLSRQYASFLHGVFFISLAAIESSSQMIVGLLNALQISMRETSSPQATLLTCLKNKEMLLILDSMEHIPAGKELLGQILLQAPQVKFLLTSQVSLNLQWEWLIEVSGLPQSASKMGPSEAAQLFQQITRRTAGELVYSPQDMPHIDHICRLVEGLPLALKLAAEATSHTALPTIAAQIEQNCDILTTSLADVSPRQRNLRATFDYSWQMLTPEEQRTMEHLSGFQGEFTLEIAKQVSEVTLRDILALIEKSFLYQVSPGHFRCHRVLRKFAAEKLQQTPGAEKTVRTHG